MDLLDLSWTSNKSALEAGRMNEFFEHRESRHFYDLIRPAGLSVIMEPFLLFYCFPHLITPGCNISRVNLRPCALVKTFLHACV
jgi:hypothetical protein